MKNKIEVFEYNDLGYAKAMNFQNWRIAYLNYTPELELDKLNNFQKHNLTDEAFILLEGSCTLFTVEVQNNELLNLKATHMEKNKVYNIPKGIYHTHCLKKDSKVLIVENEDTSDENSPTIYFGEDIKIKLKEIYKI